jgi:hypothetical protein
MALKVFMLLRQMTMPSVTKEPLEILAARSRAPYACVAKVRTSSTL